MSYVAPPSPNQPNLDGVDVSHWLTPTEDHLPGMVFITKASGGDKYRDPTLATWINKAVADRVPVIGAYHWLSINIDPVRQYDHFMRTLNDAKVAQSLDFVMIDWEWDVVTNEEPLMSSLVTLKDRLVRQWGANRVMVYSGPGMSQFVKWRESDPEAPLSLAALNIDKGWGLCSRFNVTLWQWTWTAQASGVKEPCDGLHIYNWQKLVQMTKFDPAKPDFGLFFWQPISQLPILKLGSRGREVQVVQTLLGANADGRFGSKTEARVKAFQRLMKLTPDGVVGKTQTWPALKQLAINKGLTGPVV